VPRASNLAPRAFFSYISIYNYEVYDESEHGSIDSLLAGGLPYHENETDKLLPGSASATQAESDALDKIHDELTPDVSWDDFNDTYARFSSAKDRTGACIEALKNESGEFRSKVLESMLKIADASREDDNKTNVSPEEMDFIQQIREALE
jgi:hypothetical protein